MGLLDNFSLDNLDDPKKQALITMALGLFAPKQQKTSFLNDVGTSGLLGLQTYATAQKDERANRQNDLQQVQGALGLVRQQELPRMIAAKQQGIPYQPNPMLDQLQQREAKLLGLNNISGRYNPTALPAPPPPATPGPSAPPPGMAPPSQSPMANPDYQPPQVRAPQPAPAPQSAPSNDAFGGPAGGIDPQWWMGADPSGLKYLEQLAKDNQPQSTRYGIFMRDPKNSQRYLPAGGALPQGAMPYSFDAQGNPSIAPLPGQIETAAKMAGTVAGAKEAAEFPYRTTNVQTAGGANIPQLLSSVVGQPGGSPSQPKTPGVAQLTVTQPSAQAKGPTDFWSDMPKLIEPQGLGQTTLQKVMAEEHGKAYADTAKSLASDADAANQRLAYNDAALKALPGAVTGPGANGISTFKNVLVSRFNIPESLFAEGPSNTQELNKALINSATQRAKQIYGARLAQQEVMMQVNQASPSLGMTKAAVATLLQMDSKLAQYNIQKANDFGEFSSRGGDPLRFSGWYNRKKPLSAEMDLSGDQAPASSPPAVRRYNPATGKIE